jgi:hypothetical protein
MKAHDYEYNMITYDVLLPLTAFPSFLKLS